MAYRHPRHALPVMVLSLSVWFLEGQAAGLTSGQLQRVQANLQQGATRSWELGTRAQAILELNHPEASVFSPSSLPPNPPPLESSVDDVIAIARSVVSSRPAGPGPLIANDASAADPASIGPAVLLANWTQPDNGTDYANAAAAQLSYLLNTVPRAPSGAISHLNNQVALWSDFMYMVPPFLAYYGALSGNSSLLEEAYHQSSLYRSALKSSSGLWQHIVMGSAPDSGYWATGNGWAAMGMLRVYATLKHSAQSSHFSSQQRDLANWVTEIHNAAFPHLSSSNLFSNYIQRSSFLDASSTALLAASVFRSATLFSNSNRHVPSAIQIFQTLTNGSHVDPNGWLTPVVDPYNVGQSGQDSPEGQAFLLMLQAAYQDWNSAGQPGQNSASRSVAVGPGLVVILASTIFLLST
ncbi:hypothetical protein BOTBODRAFT_30201 [Botryobasidium botryosum FD-172 SS1]|uniref:Glycoside hydrolase family 105 protein n=1 Tax=Botryobasidium botryosum (strain FD-172 SS1) TaxID=930990 RepID=A0A067MRS8_BOTB1|nr:hypothetical protein BOTBODRAFT_30201 [Botryobasidium botryosum FD-172 SS1]